MGAAVGVGDSVFFDFAGAGLGAQKTMVAMQTPMINELFLFIFSFCLDLCADNTARTGWTGSAAAYSSVYAPAARRCNTNR